MAYDKIVLAGKRIPGLAVPPAIASETVGGAGRKSKHPPLKSTQQRTGYQHKPKKPHPVVEKARRDGINALIEDLREVVPDGGWKPSTVHSPRPRRSGTRWRPLRAGAEPQGGQTRG